jgi:hypothetical protein
MTRVTSQTMLATLCLAGSVSTAQPACAAEYGLGDYLLGYSLPMAGYTPPPGLYFSNTFYLYQGSASANINFPVGTNTVAGVSYNFLFDIDQVAWVTDVKVLGGSLGFAALVPFGGESTSASLSFTGPLGVNRQFGRTASIDALGDSAFAAFLGWEEGEHHWNATLTGFAPTGYYSSTALAFAGLNRPALDLKAGYTYLSLQTGITFNMINTATNYQSGDELHIEGALNEHFPFGLAAPWRAFLKALLNLALKYGEVRPSLDGIKLLACVCKQTVVNWGQDTKVHFMPLSGERTGNIAFAGSIHGAWV